MGGLIVALHDVPHAGSSLTCMQGTLLLMLERSLARFTTVS
jgi:hypothetical protein